MAFEDRFSLTRLGSKPLGLLDRLRCGDDSHPVGGPGDPFACEGKREDFRFSCNSLGLVRSVIAGSRALLSSVKERTP